MKTQSKEHDKTHLISIFGKLPVVILVDDGINEDGTSIPNKDFVVRNHDLGIYCSLFFRKMHNTNVFPFHHAKIQSEDINGELTFSIFNAVFGGPNIDKITKEIYDKEGDINFSKLIDIVCLMINKFLRIYRVHTSKFWISEVTKNRLSPLYIQFFDQFQNQFVRFHTDYRGTGIMLGSNIDSNVHSKIKKDVFDNIEIDGTFNFMAEANKYKIRGDFKTSLLFLSFYVESWVYREIRYVLKRKDLNDIEIENYFQDKKGRSLSFTGTIRKFLMESDFNQMVKSVQYSNFKEKVINKRNDLAHGRYLDVKIEESEESVSAANEFRDYFLEMYISPNYSNSE